jgi:hypothetical protein
MTQIKIFRSLEEGKKFETETEKQIAELEAELKKTDSIKKTKKLNEEITNLKRQLRYTITLHLFKDLEIPDEIIKKYEKSYFEYDGFARFLYTNKEMHEPVLEILEKYERLVEIIKESPYKSFLFIESELSNFKKKDFASLKMSKDDMDILNVFTKLLIKRILLV